MAESAWRGHLVRQRTLIQNAFIKISGWDNAAQVVIAGDASNRRYLRLQKPDGATAILMDAPPQLGEDIAPFMEIADYLLKTGLSAPQIIAKDDSNGFLLLEDLGDALFARHMTQYPQDEATLYQTAVDVLCHLHRQPPPDLPAYDASVMTDRAALAFDWYMFGATGEVSQDAKSDFAKAFHKVLSDLPTTSATLVHRDYHAENLIWLPQRSGLTRVGLLDFQDALVGHPAYDLVSMLQDVRRKVPLQIQAEMIAYYCSKMDHPRSEFKVSYAALGLQRNLRILGVFARLCLRDAKSHYIDLIPQVWAHIETNLAHPSLSHLRPKLEKLPVPTPEILTHLKSQSGSCQTL